MGLTMANETLAEPPGMPYAMLCMMDSANRMGSWLTMDTCSAHDKSSVHADTPFTEGASC